MVASTRETLCALLVIVAAVSASEGGTDNIHAIQIPLTHTSGTSLQTDYDGEFDFHHGTPNVQYEAMARNDETAYSYQNQVMKWPSEQPEPKHLQQSQKYITIPEQQSRQYKQIQVEHVAPRHEQYDSMEQQLLSQQYEQLQHLQLQRPQHISILQQEHEQPELQRELHLQIQQQQQPHQFDKQQLEREIQLLIQQDQQHQHDQPQRELHLQIQQQKQQQKPHQFDKQQLEREIQLLIEQDQQHQHDQPQRQQHIPIQHDQPQRQRELHLKIQQQQKPHQFDKQLEREIKLLIEQDKQNQHDQPQRQREQHLPIQQQQLHQQKQPQIQHSQPQREQHGIGEQHIQIPLQRKPTMFEQGWIPIAGTPKGPWLPVRIQPIAPPKISYMKPPQTPSKKIMFQSKGVPIKYQGPKYIPKQMLHYADQYHYGQPTAPQVHGPQIHGPQVHGPQVHGPQVHGPQIHGPQMHGPQVHGPQVHGPQVHGPQIHAPQMYIKSMQRPQMMHHFKPGPQYIAQYVQQLVPVPLAETTLQLDVPPPFKLPETKHEVVHIPIDDLTKYLAEVGVHLKD